MLVFAHSPLVVMFFPRLIQPMSSDRADISSYLKRGVYHAPKIPNRVCLEIFFGVVVFMVEVDPWMRSK